nr:hypothetical protein [Aeromonas sp. sif2416]
MHDIASPINKARTGADYFRFGMQTGRSHLDKCTDTAGILQREEESDLVIQGKPLGRSDHGSHVVAHLVGINNVN